MVVQSLISSCHSLHTGALMAVQPLIPSCHSLHTSALPYLHTGALMAVQPLILSCHSLHTCALPYRIYGAPGTLVLLTDPCSDWIQTLHVVNAGLCCWNNNDRISHRGRSQHNRIIMNTTPGFGPDTNICCKYRALILCDTAPGLAMMRCDIHMSQCRALQCWV
jgi:hypothetical protein